MLITSASNPKYKAALKLKQKKHPSQILIDGVREITYALEGAVRVDHWFVDERSLSADSGEIDGLMQKIGRDPLVLSAALFEKLAYGERRSKAIAVADRPARPLEDLQLGSAPLIVVAERLEKPGNVGAIARTIDAVGADALILVDEVVDPFSTNAIRASMGTIFSKRVALASGEQTRQWLRSNNIAIVAAWVDAPLLYVEADFTRPTAIVLGSESTGLSPEWADNDMTRVSLPMSGTADSLNVSTTAAVLAYEAWRQRLHRSKSEAS